LSKKIKDGVFLEIGACDGLLYSNTKTLEDYFGFSGILIEPQKHFYEKLIINRPKCDNFNAAVSSNPNKYVVFHGFGAEAGIEENLNNTVQPQSLGKQIFSFLKSFFLQNKTSYKVKNLRMSEILSRSRFDYVDIMIIDVEGSEFDLLKSIDFTFPIFYIIIEAHSKEKDKNEIFHRHLIDNGFIFIERQRGNEVWVNPNYFRKHLFNNLAF
jgi:FkbM family methyltransferase